MIYLQLYWEFFKTGLFAVGGGMATIPFLREISLRTGWFTPAMLAEESFDEDALRRDLRRTIAAARKNSVQLEIILKDISTVRYQPQRLWRYSEIVLEECRNA